MYNRMEPLLKSLYFPESDKMEDDAELLFDVRKFKTNKRVRNSSNALKFWNSNHPFHLHYNMV